MNNSTNNSFEEQWQRAFDDASLPPSEAVWEKIDSQLQTPNPPKPNNGSYYIGAISAVILVVSLWFLVGNNEEEKVLQVVENKTVKIENKIEKLIPEKEEKLIIKPKEKTPIKKVSTPEKEEIIEPITEPEIITQIPENQERIITDSIDFMSPIMATKKVNSELVNPSINIPFEQTPYYEIPKPKSKKKSIWDKVRISGGVGVYQ
ncbi:MAG: hypothetical protein RLZZ306_832 [Bacteroidota bacterium]|jgi:hypothetical protein